MTYNEIVSASNLCCFYDSTDYRINLGDRTYTFDFSDRFGPTIINRDGRPNCGEPPQSFLRAVSLWAQQGKRVEDGFCIYEARRE